MAVDDPSESFNACGALVEKAKRTRKGGPRSKTGCITCRLRRVKCDEVKPACTRCLSARRCCEGYPSIFANTKPWEVVKVPSIGPMIKPSVNPRVASNEHAIHSFRFFERETIKKLAEVYGRELWTEIVPRAAMHCPAIWHASIALGSAHEAHWQKRFGAGVHQSKIDWTFEQYNKAIRTLVQSNERGSRPTLDVMITTSILFMGFDMLRCEHGKAIGHLRSGLDMFRDYQRQFLAGDLADQDRALIPISCLARSLRHIEIQLRELTRNHYPSYPLPMLSFFDGEAVPSGIDTQPPVTAAFLSLDDARLELGYYWNDLVGKLHGDFPPCDSKDALLPESFDGYREMYYLAVMEWFCKFTKLVETLTFSQPPLESRYRGDVARLEMYGLLLLQLIETYSCSDESVWDNYMDRFDRILELCRISAGTDQFGDPQCDMERTEAYCGFQIGNGIVAATFHVIWKCRAARIRQRAIELLKIYPRREALWDAPIVIAVGEQLDEIERGANLLHDAALRNAHAEEIPIWRRVQDIGVTFGPTSRVAELTYKVPKSSADHTKIDIKRSIVWQAIC